MSGSRILNNTAGLGRHGSAAKFLHLDRLCDRKPHVLLNKMLALMDGNTPCLLFEQVFLEQMPDDIRPLLVNDDSTDPRRLAARADALRQGKQQGEAVINTVAPWARKDKRPSSTHTDETTATSSAKATKKDKWCLYHQRWGAAAQNRETHWSAVRSGYCRRPHTPPALPFRSSFEVTFPG